MTAEAVPIDEAATTAPYRPSWIHAFIDTIDRLPGPRLVAYAGIACIGILLQHAQLWSTGRVAVGTIDLVNTYWGITIAVSLWLAGFLERSARSSFHRFRGALRVSDEEADRIGYELTIIPGRMSFVITIGAAVLAVMSFIADPEGTSTAGLPPVMLAVAFVIQTFVGAVLGQVLYRLLRQVRIAREILDRSVDVDVFRPAPLNAIATLTALPGASLIVPVTDEPGAFIVAWGPILVLPPLIAFAAFVAPLTGAHARLEAQKDWLQDTTEQRIRGLLDDLDRDVDARDLTQVDGYHKALTTLVVERDILAKLPTWPWSTATLRGFVTTILLPLGLFLAQQTLSQLF